MGAPIFIPDNMNNDVDNNHFKSIICDATLSCFVLGTSSSALIDALPLHGIMYDGLNSRAWWIALVPHLLYGHCHHCSLPTCQIATKTATSMGKSCWVAGFAPADALCGYSYIHTLHTFIWKVSLYCFELNKKHNLAVLWWLCGD